MKIPWTPWERRWRDALCCAMVPGDAAMPGLGDVDTEAFWREYEQRAPAMLRVGFRASVWLLTLAPIMLLRRPVLFHKLSAAEQDMLLQRVSRSPVYLIRQFPFTIKLMSCFAYLRDDDVRSRVEELSAQ